MSAERIGIVGGGQLGQMLTQAAKPLGFEVTVLEPLSNPPAVQVGAEQIQNGLQDPDALRELAEKSDVVTWEIEHIGAQDLYDLEQGGYNIQPSPLDLMTIQDKLEQKRFLERHGIPVAPFYQIRTEEDLQATINKFGPVVVKSRSGGYDGRSNLIMESPDWGKIKSFFGDAKLYAEQKIALQKELSVLIAKGVNGQVMTYPTVETVHSNNICDVAVMPARVPAGVNDEAQEVARAVADQLEGQGLFAIEMFVTRDDKIMVNEIAPRVHNSGHMTIEGSKTSQFEQHIRAVTGARLGSTESVAPAAMANILFGPVTFEGIKRVLRQPDIHPHFYGKEPRENMPRKIGHITALGTSANRAVELVLNARRELTNGEKQS
ncbi:MAG TPA: 5-(carboxyamino)imidazole ribonucleotide synthase [Candidatus Saccharimonadales bacterium]|nr:5-(carboxyamino)imidazole ribonucleotide synthase [Candidatus Saccharimonadales bacterium]